MIPRTTRSLLCASVLAFTGPAVAGTLTSPPIVGHLLVAGTDNQTLRCWVTNIGKKDLAIEAVSIYAINGNVQSILTIETCLAAPVLPNATCVFGVVADQAGGTGSVTFRGSAKNVRGLCQVYDADDDAIQSEAEMR